jgi:hypothetical protein
MKTETDLHPIQWKSGTEALALCMICAAEYPPDTRECPDCNVTLSVVRRCPKCAKIVSAQHKRCVHCRMPFTLELPEGFRPAPEAVPANTVGPSRAVRRFRAALVSVSTFIIVFTLGMLFMRQINKPAFPLQIIAQAKVIHAAELRRSASSTASNAGQLTTGTTVNLTGFQENDRGRWVAVDVNNSVLYLPASAIAAPFAVEAGEGGNALKFYLAGMESGEAAEQAVKAVDDYAKNFPKDGHTEELRLALADRLKSFAQRGGPRAADLHRQAMQQYEKIAASNGQYAGRAREALAKPASAPQHEAKPRVAPVKREPVQIIGASGAQISTIQSASRNVMVLTQAEVRVRAGKLVRLAAGTVIPARVANAVKTNGMIAIPAGALCQLTVESSDPSLEQLTVTLSSIEIDHRTYPVRSQLIEIRGNTGEHTLGFRLEAPLIISR